jgi:hypothetical protein
MPASITEGTFVVSRAIDTWHESYRSRLRGFDFEVSSFLLAQPVPTTATLAARLILDVFGLSNHPQAERIVHLSIGLDHFAQVVDRQIDGHTTPMPLSFHAASLLLSECASILGTIAGNSLSVWDAWRSHLQEASLGDRTEQAALLADMPVIDTRKCQSRKSAYVKIVADVCAELSGRREDLGVVYVAIDNILQAIEWVDDLIDWRADYSSGRLTEPLRMVLKDANAQTEDNIGQTLFSGAVPATILLTIEDHIKAACALLDPRIDGAGHRDLRQALAGIESARRIFIASQAPLGWEDREGQLRRRLTPLLQYN